MDISILTAVVSLILAIVGLFGIIIPVLPGSLLIGVGVLLWGLFGGSAYGLPLIAICLPLLIIGGLGSYLLTHRKLKEREIPTGPIMFALVCAVIGMFLLPGIGLILGFVVGLLVAELIRHRNLSIALTSSWEASKAIGIGMLIELATGLIAVGLLSFAVVSTYLFA